jgi:hypothetical protein
VAHDRKFKRKPVVLVMWEKYDAGDLWVSVGASVGFLYCVGHVDN